MEILCKSNPEDLIIFNGGQIFFNGEYVRKSIDLIDGFFMKGKYSAGLIEPE